MRIVPAIIELVKIRNKAVVDLHHLEALHKTDWKRVPLVALDSLKDVILSLGFLLQRIRPTCACNKPSTCLGHDEGQPYMTHGCDSCCTHSGLCYKMTNKEPTDDQTRILDELTAEAEKLGMYGT